MKADPSTCSHDWERQGQRNFFACSVCEAVGYSRNMAFGPKFIKPYLCNAIIEDKISKAPTSCSQIAIQRYGSKKRCRKHKEKHKSKREDDTLEAIRLSEERNEDVLAEAMARLRAQTDLHRPASRRQPDDSDPESGGVD